MTTKLSLLRGMSLRDDKQQNIQMELDFSSALTRFLKEIFPGSR